MCRGPTQGPLTPSSGAPVGCGSAIGARCAAAFEGPILVLFVLVAVAVPTKGPLSSKRHRRPLRLRLRALLVALVLGSSPNLRRGRADPKSRQQWLQRPRPQLRLPPRPQRLRAAHRLPHLSAIPELPNSLRTAPPTGR